jgi:glycerol-3-phosphate acyltransferase PlsY
MYAVYLPGIVIAYLLGSIPFGLIIARAHGKNLRTIGSGNIGATNVSRALGKRWAYVCFALDVLKGLLPTAGTMLVAEQVLPQTGQASVLSLWLWLAVGCAAIIGHIFPVYIEFKGGKGVATSFGVALGIWPYFTICAAFALLIWVIVVRVSRYVSLGSISAAVAFPAILAALIAILPGWSFGRLWPLLTAATAIPTIVITRHRENIKGLLVGTESRISARPAVPTHGNTTQRQ